MIKKILIVLDNQKQTHFFLKCLAKGVFKDASLMILAVDHQSKKLLQNKNMLYCSEQEINQKARMNDVSESAYLLAENWWKNETITNLDLNCDGLNLCPLIEWEAVYFFLWILRTICFVETLIAETKPDEIWAFQYGRGDSNFFRDGEKAAMYGPVALKFGERKSIKVVKFDQQKNQKTLRTSSLRHLACKITGPRFRNSLSLNQFHPIFVLKCVLGDLVSGFISVVFHIIFRITSKRDVRDSILISGDYPKVAPVCEKLYPLKNFKLIYLRDIFPIKLAIPFLSLGVLCVSDNWYSKNLKGIKSAGRYKNDFLKNPIFSFHGLHFGELLENEFNYLLNRRFPELRKKIDSFRRLLTEERISKIVVDEDVCAFNKTLIQTANQMNIPSVVVQHGYAGIRVAFSPLSATRFAAWGPVTKQRLMEWGVPGDRIEVTGNVVNDRIPQLDGSSRTEFLKSLGLNPNLKTVLLTMFPYRDYMASDFPEVEAYVEWYEKFMKVVWTAVRAIEGTQLIIKLHPRDKNLERIQNSFTKNTDNRVVVIQDFKASDCIQSCDVLLTALSSIMIDCLPFKKPLIVLDPTGNPTAMSRMVALNVPIVSINAEAVELELKKVFDGRYTGIADEMVSDHLSSLDGNASKRIADLLLSLRPEHVAEEPKKYDKMYPLHA